MYGFIFGFQRLVWWPKWTPASIMSRMVSGVSRAGWKTSCGTGGLVSVWIVGSIDFLSRFFPPLTSTGVLTGAVTAGTRGALDQRVVLKRGQVSTTISTDCSHRFVRSFESFSRERALALGALILLRRLGRTQP